MKTALFVKYSSVNTVNSVYNTIYFLEKSNIEIEIFIIAGNEKNIEFVKKKYSNYTDKITIKKFDLYKSNEKKPMKFAKFSLSLLFFNKYEKKIYDKIIIFGDAALFQNQILRLYNSKNIIFWMLELPLKYTLYYNKLTRHILSWFEESLVKKSSCIVVPNFERKVFLERIKLYFRKKISVIENYPKITDLGLKHMLDDSNEYSTPYICFTGYIANHTLPLKLFIDAITKINSKYNISLYLAGKTDFECKKIIEQNMKNPHIRYFNYLDSEEVLRLQKNSLAGVATYLEQSQNHILCAPQKLYEYLNLEIPILCSNNLPLLNLVKNNNLGIVIDEFSVDNLVNSIERIYLYSQKYKKSINEWKTKYLNEENIYSDYDKILNLECEDKNER